LAVDRFPFETVTGIKPVTAESLWTSVQLEMLPLESVPPVPHFINAGVNHETVNKCNPCLSPQFVPPCRENG
jgi:hypothetical protein